MATHESSNPQTCSPSSVSEVARSQVRRYLKRVVKALRQVKRGRASDEAVHELRVWSRRTATALEFFAPVVPRKKAQQLRRTMQKLRRAAGDVRDCDVLLAALQQQETSLQSMQLARQVQRSRRRAAKPLMRRAEKWTTGRKLQRRGKRVADSIRWRRRSGNDSEPVFAVWGRQQLQPLLKEFMDAARGDLSSDDALHTCRIAAKRLRYAAELVGSVCPEFIAGTAYEQLMRLQDRLGRVCDHRANADRLGCETDEAKQRKQPIFERVAARERQMLKRAKRQFLRWWTPARQRTMANTWNRLLAGDKSNDQRTQRQPRNSQPK